MEKLKNTEIEELLIRYSEGLVTEEEEEHIKRMLEQSDEIRQIAIQLFSLDLYVDTFNLREKIDVDKALSKFKKKIAIKKKSIFKLEWMQRVAAILFIPLLSICLLQYFGWLTNDVTPLIEVKTNPGVTSSFTLPDGSTVMLNAGSSLVYPSRFTGDNREVTLDGEAYFEVAKNPDKKFVVSLPQNAQIEVLGTHFNVEAYSALDEITTTLLEGKVCFETPKDNWQQKITMHPGQKLIYEHQSGATHLLATTGKSELSWKEGKIIFEETPLKEALRMLTKRFGVEFVLKNERMRNEPFTGAFSDEGLEYILEYFKVASGIHWKYVETPSKENKQVEIY